ncbi:MAG: DNA polymerase IV [Candidatus Zixiibacteriota bacterium]
MTERLTTFPLHQRRVLKSGQRPPRRIMHVDMDAYFAALEQAINPHLRNRPVVVGSPPRARGVVSTASYECRVHGIRSGMSSAQAYRLCPQAVFVGVDVRHYVYASSELLKIYEDYSPTVEVVSVDEAFLDITGCASLFGDEEQLAMRLKERLRSELSLTCSVGIAPNKIMAKMASSVFKPDGLTIIMPADIPRILYPLPVEKMWGVGPVMRQVLAKLGVLTVGDLARCDPRTLRRYLGKVGEVWGRLARGDDDSPVLAPDDQPPEKSIGHEHTLSADSNRPDHLYSVLHDLSDRVARRMRRHGWRGRTVTVKYRFQDYSTHTCRATFPTPTDDSRQIYRVASDLFGKHWDGRAPIRLLGVSASHLEQSESLAQQTDLFSRLHLGSTRRPSVDSVVDDIRDRFGERAIWGGYSAS